MKTKYVGLSCALFLSLGMNISPVYKIAFSFF
jgi:hypothetical protein